MSLKLYASDKTIGSNKTRIIEVLWKLLNILKNYQFIFWVILILIFYITKKQVLIENHKARRFEVNIVENFIPLGVVKEQKLKHILIWNSITDNHDKTDDLQSVDCDSKNCIFTSNRRLLPSLTDYDAIMFDVGGSNKVYDLPRIRKYNQIYIMADTE